MFTTFTMVVVLQCIYMHYVTLNPPDDYDGCSVALYTHALCDTETLRRLRRLQYCNAFTCIIQRCDSSRSYERINEVSLDPRIHLAILVNERILDTIRRYIGLIPMHELQAARCCQVDNYSLYKSYFTSIRLSLGTSHRKCQSIHSSIQVQQAKQSNKPSRYINGLNYPRIYRCRRRLFDADVDTDSISMNIQQFKMLEKFINSSLSTTVCIREPRIFGHLVCDSSSIASRRCVIQQISLSITSIQI